MKKSKSAPPKQTGMTTPKSGYHVDRLFWGASFLTIGILLFLDAFDMVNLELSSLWRLWPLIIVAIGVSIIQVRGFKAAILTGLLMLGTLTLLVTTLLGILPKAQDITRTQRFDISRSSENIEELSVAIKSGASTIKIGSAEDTETVSGDLKSSFSRIAQKTYQTGSTQYVELETVGNNNWWRGEYKNDLTIDVTKAVPVNLDIDAGAVDFKADLSGIRLRNLTIDSGVSGIELKLGDRTSKTDVRFNIGVSSVKFIIPKTSGVSLRLDSGLSSKETPGLTEKSEGYYESSNYATASHTIDIEGEMGMADLVIEYY